MGQNFYHAAEKHARYWPARASHKVSAFPEAVS
jgi:hypothetical protein